MISTIYVEDSVLEHPRTRKILTRFNKARMITCHHYGELFNRHNQNFRLQKAKPALILARKLNRRILPIPAGYGLQTNQGFYFSHILNCLYDCRYCFLQGMFKSAHYVLFVNYEDFILDIESHCQKSHEDLWFFSGYDCDSLALDPLTNFVNDFVPKLTKLNRAWLELRTKSTQIRALLEMEPKSRCVCAFSLSPTQIIASFEHKTPNLDARLDAIRRLTEFGWPVGIRFDPLIAIANFKNIYGKFFDYVFTKIDASRIHSVTIGGFRMPASFQKSIARMYPEEALYAVNLERHDGYVSYPRPILDDVLGWSMDQVKNYVPSDRIFLQQT